MKILNDIKYLKLYFILPVLMLLNVSCKVAPQPIQYGTEACDYCSMTIVDEQHAAQVVTKKGRAAKFDAIECMVNYLSDTEMSEIGLFLITDFAHPGELIDATEATYLISPEIPSPMGADLSGFSERNEAASMARDHNGEIFTWSELLAKYRDQKAGAIH